MLKRLFIFLVFSLLAIGQIMAQNRTVKGKVTDADTNEGIPGVSVSVKGTTSGTTTDVDGNFELSVAEGAVLIFQGVGLTLQEVAVGTQSMLSVAMKSESKQLGEVVVVGYGGLQDRKDLTGVVGTVKGSDVANLPVQSFEQALQGRIAGVSITTPNGVLGNPPVIRVRGTNSITSGSQPLIVIDGLPIFSGQASSGTFTSNNALADINPNDIESYEVLKDASASAIYGSRATNGVILVTTKKGQKGKAKVQYSSWVGYTEAFRKFSVLNAQQFITMKNEAAANNPAAAGGTVIANPTFNPDGSLVDTDWYSTVYQAGFQQNHHLSIGGGDDKTKYYFGFGYTDQNGMLVQNKFRRFTGRFNVSHEVTSYLTVGANMQMTNSFNRAPNTGSNGPFGIGGLGRLPLVLPPNVRVRNLDGSYNIETGNRIGRGNNTQPSGSFYNPLPDQELSKFTSENNVIIGNIYAEFKLLKNLKFTSTMGINSLGTEDIDFRNALHGEGQTLNGLATNVFSRATTWNWQNSVNYSKTFNNKHSIDLLLGAEYQQTKFNTWGGSRQNISDPFFTSYQGSFVTNNPPPVFQTENALESYFFRANYSFMGKYLFTASVRRDGYSALSKSNKFGNFGGISAGWRISDENFIKNTSALSFIDDFKIRASYGRLGNVNIGDFSSLNFFNSGLYGAAPTWVFSQVGNSDLKWESSTKTDIGFDASFFKGRVQASFSYYLNNIDNLIIGNPQPPSMGIPGNSIAQNVGTMENKGIELTITTTNIKKEDFEWTTDFNITTNRNKVLSLNERGSDIPGTTGGLEQTNITRVGEPVGSLFAVRAAGVNPANGRAMFINAAGRVVQYDHSAPAASRWTFVEDGSVATSPAGDRVIAGNTNPTWFGGIGNTIRYKNFDFNLFLQFSGGNYIYNGTRAGLLDQRMWNNSTDILARWTTPGQNTDIPRVVFGDNFSNGSAFPITRNIEKGDFMRIRNITLGYTLPASILKKTGVSKIRLYAQIQNALVFTNYKGSDPEISTNGGSNLAPGVDRNSTPQARTYSFGINVNF